MNPTNKMTPEDLVNDAVLDLAKQLEKQIDDGTTLTDRNAKPHRGPVSLWIYRELKHVAEELIDHEIDLLNENAAYQADPEGAIRDADNWRFE